MSANLIRFGKKTKHLNKRQIEIECLGVSDKKVIALVPYGIICKPWTEDTHVLLLQQEGYEDSLFAIQTDLKNIDTELNDKEVYFGIPDKKSRLKFMVSDKITLTAKQNLELITEQKLLIKNTAETLKGLMNTFIDAFNNLAVVTQTTSSSNPDTGHTHAIIITGVINALATLKTRFDSLLTDK